MRSGAGFRRILPGQRQAVRDRSASAPLRPPAGPRDNRAPHPHRRTRQGAHQVHQARDREHGAAAVGRGAVTGPLGRYVQNGRGLDPARSADGARRFPGVSERPCSAPRAAYSAPHARFRARPGQSANSVRVRMLRRGG